MIPTNLFKLKLMNKFRNKFPPRKTPVVVATAGPFCSINSLKPPLGIWAGISLTIVVYSSMYRPSVSLNRSTLLNLTTS